MAGFKIPQYLEHYLSSAEYRKPIGNFVNQGTYYAGLDAYWINYMKNVVRPCIAYSTHSVDGVYNNLLSTGTGKAIVDGATRVVCGEKVFFEGDDEATQFLSDIWSSWANFDIFLERATRFCLVGGTAPIKIDLDRNGRPTLSTTRIDRATFATDDKGDVIAATYFISLLSSLKSEAVDEQYWLVEQRKYNKDGEKVIIYKVFHKSGTANATTLPDPDTAGISYKYCPPKVKKILNGMGVTELNREYILPFTDGLGAWNLLRTASNSCIPDAFLGDPLLYGCLDLLWSMDVVFSGSLIDVFNGKGKVLVPKQFLSQIMQQLKATAGVNATVTTEELDGYGDESFVYVQPSGFDKQKDTPTTVQFDIRAEQYAKLWELYQKEAVVRAGFAPTTLFPHLQDGSVYTAEQVSSEDNLTRASVKKIHKLIIPTLNRAIREVCRLEGYSDNVSIKLSDYIGNKIKRDENIRFNYQAGLIPQTVAVQQINDTTESETQDLVEKIHADKEAENKMQQQTYGSFGDYDGSDFLNANKAVDNEEQAVPTEAGAR